MVTDKLNTEWATKLRADAVFRFRAAAEQAYDEIISSLSVMDGLIASGELQGVDAEIVSEGAAVRKALNDAKIVLDGKAPFIRWRQQ